MPVRTMIFVCTTLVLLAATGTAWGQSQVDPAETPPQLVETYDTLADAILATKQTEWNLVNSILASTYSHAAATMGQVKARLDAGEGAREEIELLATLVSQLANEGDAAVAAVRKRLVEAGHHHHASGTQQAKYDPGFVIVTRAAKKNFLDAANGIGRLASSRDVARLEAEWNKVEQEFAGLQEAAP